MFLNRWQDGHNDKWDNPINRSFTCLGSVLSLVRIEIKDSVNKDIYCIYVLTMKLVRETW